MIWLCLIPVVFLALAIVARADMLRSQHEAQKR